MAADEKAITRDWYERAGWLHEAGYEYEAELTEALAECRTRIHRLEEVADDLGRVADDMSACLKEQRAIIDTFIELNKAAERQEGNAANLVHSPV